MAKCDPFLSSDCASVEGVGAQSKERKGSNFAAQHSGAIVQKPKGPNIYYQSGYSHLATMEGKAKGSLCRHPSGLYLSYKILQYSTKKWKLGCVNSSMRREGTRTRDNETLYTAT